MAGPEVAGRTRVGAFQKGTLTIVVPSAALKHHLATFRRAELVEGLRLRLEKPLFRELRFRVGEVS